MRHVLSLFDLSSEEIRRVLEISADLKSKLNAGNRPGLLEHQVMGLLFEKPSLRTRVSFETLIRQLGGSALFLGEDVGWGKREPLCDFMPILTSYLDVLVIRAKSHEQVVEATKFSECPIINGLTDVSHPCQALADILTIQELAGGLSDVSVAYLGDANNVTYSLAVACSKLNIPLRIGAPDKYQFDPAFINQLNEAAGSTIITQTSDAVAAAADAAFVYTDVWTSMGQEAESQQRLSDLADYQVNQNIMNSARDGAKFLHCLPARRGEEVTSEVIDSPQSAIIQQANNRLHAQKGLVVWLLSEASKSS
ncbi:MAG: ornithine carbamoyltransferase [Planctomycetaceae bacterium]|nr:ornithine carbamoyltransferase [Planctomycetaceae bacterium]